MTEFRVEFGSAAQWRAWAGEHEAQFDRLRESVLAAVREQGLVEPLTGQARKPAEIRIDAAMPAGSITAHQLGAADRALLHEIEYQRARQPRLQRARARIYAPEALSRLASIFRSRYPQFLGSEFLPTEKERREHFPIPHVDLQAIELPAGFFDLVFASAQLAQQDDPARTLAGIARILRPGGLLVAAVPFDPRSEASVTAAPVAPSGSTAPPPRRIFGWNLLAEAARCGLEDVRVVLHISAEHGITAGATTPGEFVLVARTPEPAARAAGAARARTQFERVVGILSIPRSGTTMLTAAFSAAPGVAALYEPFNADKAERWREGDMTIARLLADYKVAADGRPILVVKETCARFEYIDLMRQLLADVQPPAQRALLVILRNPLHCFLSEVQGRREWWGEPDLQISTDLFDQWAQRTIRGLRRIIDLLHDTGGACVSYSALVRRPEEIAAVFGAVGIPVTGEETRFFEHMDTTQVRGDISLAKNPRPFSTDSEDRRSLEQQQLVERVRGARRFAAMQRLVDAIEALAGEIVIPSGAPAVGALRDLLKALAR